MSSIVTKVFEATIGLLLNKGRDKAAEKLKDGDVTDEKIRELIVREIDDIKSKLDGLSRKDLLASISFFKEGIQLLYEAFDKAKSRSENGGVTTQAAFAEALSLARGKTNLNLTDLDESANRALSKAKNRFEDSRKEATRAFNNEALETSDRILAMQYRVMATILETLDNPADAVAPCRVCIDELNCLSAVQQCFTVELAKGFRSRFGKNERRKTISNVCHVNHVIYNVTVTALMVSLGLKELLNWPCIGSGEDKVDPLRDERVTEVLRQQGMEHCCVTWSFGQEGEEEHRPRDPRGIATNSIGQFVVGVYQEKRVKVYDSGGKFINLFSLPNDSVDKESMHVLDVATDMNDNIYVLAGFIGYCTDAEMLQQRRRVRFFEPARLSTPPKPLFSQKPLVARSSMNAFGVVAPSTDERTVYKYSNTADLRVRFSVRADWYSRLRVTDTGKVLVLRTEMVHMVYVYESDGQFVGAFGKDILKRPRDMTVANDGRVMVLDWEDSCVHIFSEHGDHLNKFKLRGCYSMPRIAFHRESEHAVVAGEDEKGLLNVEVYTKDGEFVCSSQIRKQRCRLGGVAVTTEGRIALACGYSDAGYVLVI